MDYAFRRQTRADEPSIGASTLCKDNSYDNSKPVMNDSGRIGGFNHDWYSVPANTPVVLFVGVVVW